MRMTYSDRRRAPNNLLPQICLYCWNHIKGQLNGLCPACRAPYSDDPHKISPVDRDECVGGGGGDACVLSS